MKNILLFYCILLSFYTAQAQGKVVPAAIHEISYEHRIMCFSANAENALKIWKQTEDIGMDLAERTRLFDWLLNPANADNIVKFIEQPNLLKVWNEYKGVVGLNLESIFAKFPKGNKGFYTKFFETFTEGGVITEDALRFLEDVQNSGDDFIGAFKGNAALFDAWKLLKNTGLKTNLTWLNRINEWVDEGLEIVQEGQVIKILKNGEQIAEISNDVLKVKYPYFGGDIICDPNKTTTILGKFEDLSNGGGTTKLINDGLYKVGENKGGLNVLSFIGTGMTEAQQWAVNQGWLLAAINRNDVIRVVSDPNNISNLFRTTNGVPVSSLDSPQRIAQYLNSLSDETVISQLTFFGREVKLLSENGYLFDLVKKEFVK